MRNMIRCPACGRRRKPSHEQRCGDKEVSYTPQCQRYTKKQKKEPTNEAVVG